MYQSTALLEARSIRTGTVSSFLHIIVQRILVRYHCILCGFERYSNLNLSDGSAGFVDRSHSGMLDHAIL